MGIMVPTGHKVLIKPDPIEKESTGGILLVKNEEMERAMQQWGTIEALGPDCWLAFRKIDDNGVERNGQPWAKVGDRVFYSRNAGRFVNHPETDEQFTIINDNDVSIVYKVEDKD